MIHLLIGRGNGVGTSSMMKVKRGMERRREGDLKEESKTNRNIQMNIHSMINPYSMTRRWQSVSINRDSNDGNQEENRRSKEGSSSLSSLQKRVYLNNRNVNKNRVANENRDKIKEKKKIKKRDKEEEEEGEREMKKERRGFERKNKLKQRTSFGGQKFEKIPTKYLLDMTIGTKLMDKSLQEGIRKNVSLISREALRHAGNTLSESLRARTTSRPTIVAKIVKPGEKASAARTMLVSKEVVDTISYTREKATAYLAHRFPGVVGVIERVYMEVNKLVPQFQPQTMLDFGSGPGTAIFPAKKIFGDFSVQQILAIEPSNGMIDIAEPLLRDLITRTNTNIQWRRFFYKTDDSKQHSLVVSSYVLSELKDDEERKKTVKNLWDATEVGGMFIIIEPGTPVGFNIIKRAREQIIPLRGPKHLPSLVGPVIFFQKCLKTQN
eukprot:TRINITY_DN2913_c0_g1_i1.p1 TRINITY_DN2913_c0_g1~~TRINITY_DN2913_c0_g1_i1.p1  ORF type:complete len:438 (-),score=149.34 TRINITY_DN2913_c0_g1_i1:1102-2415(-)